MSSFSNNSMEESGKGQGVIIQVFRWIGIGVVPLITSCILYAIILALWNNSLGRMINDNPKNLEAVGMFVASCLSGFCIPFIGAALAPRGKYLTAVILASIFCTIHFVAIIMSFGQLQYNCSSVGNMLGEIVSAIYCFKTFAPKTKKESIHEGFAVENR